MQEPRSIAGIEGRLLVLDAKANQILVYEPGTGGYDGAPKPYTNANLMLSGVVDMQVDGDVYLLYADGLVAKLRGGQQVPFEPQGPGCAHQEPDRNVRDSGAGRRHPRLHLHRRRRQPAHRAVHQRWRVRRQFMPKRGDSSFANIRGLSVDEKTGKMLILSNTKLLLANLPQ